jgi:hypothetical protein
VSPILSATVAISLARRRIERHAWVEREVRLSIADDAEVGEGLRLRGLSDDSTLLFAAITPIPRSSGPEPDTQSQRLGLSVRGERPLFRPNCPKFALVGIVGRSWSSTTLIGSGSVLCPFVAAKGITLSRVWRRSKINLTLSSLPLTFSASGVSVAPSHYHTVLCNEPRSLDILGRRVWELACALMLRSGCQETDG